jgi:glycosyltransferase involved in cell wall biosynthesis
MKIIFVVNKVSYFLSHRLPIGTALIERGFKVYIVAPDECPDGLVKTGFIYHQVKMSREGKNPWNELTIIWSLTKLFKKIKPDLVHLVTIKPYLYGGIAARIAGVPSVVSAVAGLGILFSQNSLKNKLLRSALFPIYYFAFRHKSQTVIFQNSNDRDLLVNWGILNKNKSVLIRGAGADLTKYTFVDESAGVPVILFAARLLLDKGVSEFVEASKILRCRNIDAEFWLIGDPDSGNANSVTFEQLDQWKKAGLVKYFRHSSDIATLLSQSNIVTLPSYYGEGLPKILIEAAACGRAVVTTNHPGCRDAIEPNETGLLVPVKDATALADSIEYLIDNSDERKAMGKAGRALAEKEFSIEKIVDKHITIYRNLLDKVKL